VSTHHAFSGWFVRITISKGIEEDRIHPVATDPSYGLQAVGAVQLWALFRYSMRMVE
jgi:hypothetical protein